MIRSIILFENITVIFYFASIKIIELYRTDVNNFSSTQNVKYGSKELFITVMRAI